MKTYKGLYEKIASFENLHSAFRKAAKGKGLRADCAGFSYGREREILLLQEELQSGTYRHGPYREFAVRDPKVREVKAARFRDRVVHHALCNVIEPIFEARFLPESFACRKGKGTLAALTACRRSVRRFAPRSWPPPRMRAFGPISPATTSSPSGARPASLSAT